MRREELVGYLDGLLDSQRFKDYSPNGLQVEGAGDVRRIVAGVTANQALIDVAVQSGADTLLVHHGWFWRGEDGRVTGFRKARMQALLKHDINLLAYHLPLDGHPELGNNAQLGRFFGWASEGRFGEQDLGWHGRVGQPMALAEMAREIAKRLNRQPLVVGGGNRRVERIAWCSGGAQGYFEEAVTLGVDAYLCGEISEHNVHLARESDVAFIAAGHHATERFGVQAVARHISEQLGLECEFVDIDSPV